MNDCKCGHCIKYHEYNFTIGEPEPCTICDCKDFEENKGPEPTCGDCERRPRTYSGRCYYDLLKRNRVKKSSEACDNFKRKEFGRR